MIDDERRHVGCRLRVGAPAETDRVQVDSSQQTALSSILDRYHWNIETCTVW